MDFKLSGALVKKEDTIDEKKEIHCRLQFRTLKDGDKHQALCVVYDKNYTTNISEIIKKVKEYSEIYFTKE